jgi:hypothetical protein
MVSDRMCGPCRRRTKTCIGQLELAVVSDRREHESGCGEGEGVRLAHGPGGMRQRGAAHGLYDGTVCCGRGTKGYTVRAFSGPTAGNEELRIPRCLR